MYSNKHIKVLIFDFGNVIINIDFNRTFQAFQELFGDEYDSIMKQYKEDKFHEDVEESTYTAEMMAKRLNTYGANVTADEVKNAWNALLLDVPPARIELLKKLSQRYKLYLLSNTNYVHIQKIYSDLEAEYGSNPITEIFDKLYLSYEVGYVKPKKELYQYVIDDIGYNPSECLFFDDLQENLDGAASIGIQTQLVTKEKGILELFDASV